MDKLERDGYLKLVGSTYLPTLEGIMFSDSGAYVQRKQDAIDERNRLVDFDKRVARANDVLSTGTVVLAVATSLLFLVELLKWICG